jgi:hypothetical protein
MAKTQKNFSEDGKRDILTANNAWKPVFFKAAVEGSDALIAFPDNWAKSFYVECLKGAFSGLPIQILAYSVLHNRAYFVIASLDQAPISFLRYLETANARYSVYYRENYLKTSQPFLNSIVHKRIKDETEVFDAMAVVHSQPAIRGLCSGYADYAYTSYNDINARGPSNIVALQQMFDKEYIASAYASAHAAIRPMPVKFLPLRKYETFDSDFENCLVDYRIYGKDSVPKEIMAKIIIDLNQKSGYFFDFTTDMLFTRRHEKYELLVMVVSELCVRFHFTFDEALACLSVVAKDDTLIKDVAIYINNELGYGYDYLMQIMGLAYPNTDFFLRLLNYICDMKGISKEAALEKLGIRDPAMVRYAMQN